MLFVITIGAAVATFSWMTPDRYTAHATILSNQPSERLSTLASLGPRITMALGGSGMQSDRQIYPTLLRSRSVIEPLLHMPLPTRTGETTTLAATVGLIDIEEICAAVRKMLNIRVDGATGVCYVALTMNDPVTAASACNALVESLALRGVSFRTADAHKVRSFIADRLADIKTELVNAEKRLRDFRNQNRNYNQTANPDLLLADERLAREVTLKSNLYLQLFEEYESARIEEKRDIASVQILDSAYVPNTASGPRRVRTTAMATVAAGPFAIAILLGSHFIACALPTRRQHMTLDQNA
jgi:uncharacterized protein involved in exopolysaccharide biosynthesis